MYVDVDVDYVDGTDGYFPFFFPPHDDIQFFIALSKLTENFKNIEWLLVWDVFETGEQGNSLYEGMRCGDDSFMMSWATSTSEKYNGPYMFFEL